MINNNTIIVYDMETTSANPHTTQPIQLAAVAIHSQKLEIIPGSEFESLIKPIEDEEEQSKLGLGVIEDEALRVNGKNIEELRCAPPLKIVWDQFVQYIDNYNFRKNIYTAPILAGYNIIGFDNIILNRIAGPHGWNYGPWDNKKNTNSLFSQVYKIDLLDTAFMWFSNCAEPSKLKLTSLLEYLGMSTTGSHDALIDVKNTANLVCKFLRLHRELASRVKWNPNV